MSPLTALFYCGCPTSPRHYLPLPVILPRACAPFPLSLSCVPLLHLPPSAFPLCHSERKRGISLHPPGPVSTTLHSPSAAHCQCNRFFARPFGLSLNDRAVALLTAPIFCVLVRLRTPSALSLGLSQQATPLIHAPSFFLSAYTSPASNTPITRKSRAPFGARPSLFRGHTPSDTCHVMLILPTGPVQLPALPDRSGV